MIVVGRGRHGKGRKLLGRLGRAALRTLPGQIRLVPDQHFKLMTALLTTVFVDRHGVFVSKLDRMLLTASPDLNTKFDQGWD